MFRVLATVRRNIRNVKKNPRVADESMFRGNNNIIVINNGDELPRRTWTGSFSVVLSVVRAPLSILTCLSHPHVSGADGVWVSGEFAQISEMNHLMVNDSMRYAILM